MMQGLLTIVGLLAALGVGWAWRGRRLAPAGFAGEPVGRPAPAGHSAELAVVGGSSPAVVATSDGLIEQLLAANEALHAQLAQAERRIRELRVGTTTASESVVRQIASTEPSEPPADEDVGNVGSEKAVVIHSEIEQRAHERRKLMQAVLLAPYVENSFPTNDDFFTAKGFDISEAGIAFYLSTPPAHDEYVVVLGSAEHPIYVRAQIVRVAKRHMYLIGCRFVGRLHRPEAAVDAPVLAEVT